MSIEQDIAALLAERASYEARGLPLRIAAVDASLAALGYKAAAPVVIETADAQFVVETAVRRGRPRKAD